MSTFTAFEKAKLRRFINVYGNTFTFRRRLLNAYKEPTDDTELVTSIAGVYHEASGTYVSESVGEGSRYIKEQQPMILCLQDEDAKLIMPDDIVEIAERRYSVVRLKAVGGFDYAWEISLELIDDGVAI